MRSGLLRLGLGLGVGMVGTMGGCLSGGASPAGPLPDDEFGGSGGTTSSGGSSGKAGKGGSSAGGEANGSSGEGGMPGSGAMSGAGGEGTLPPGAGVGEECAETDECRVGLECVDDECAPTGTGAPGTPCLIQPECAEALQCVGGVCLPEGAGGEGVSCVRDADCEAGLRCVLSGIVAVCEPQGTTDAGDECDASADCYGGLFCTGDGGTCDPTPPPIPGGFWPGVECEEPSTGTVRAYFEVPSAEDADEGDFFRLPFPNDVRRSSGGIDLEGFPTPGPGLLGLDVVDRYVDAVEAEADGWSAYSTILFRFSGVLSVDSLRADGSVNFVDVTPGAPELGSGSGFGWYYSGGRTPYVCENWFGVRRPQGEPMLPGHTYAVWLTTQIEDEDGGTIERSANLIDLLDDSAPSDAALADAYEAYAPFRAYLADEGIAASTILNATVFTVGGVRDPMAELAAAAEAAPVATVTSDWVLCDEGVESPCPDREGERNCGAAATDYDEYHAVVSLPRFQEGTAPYVTPDDGGAIAVSDDPEREDVCLALTVPKGDVPANGFPLVVFAHGTGGSFRNHATASVAGALSSGATKFAVLGIDQVVHGTRRNGSTESPDNLFFNFFNPAAARGNPLQGAADQIALARFAATIDGTGEMPTTVDPTQLYFFGHSQGATEGSLMLPYADVYKAALLSGNGASLIDALLTKTRPVNLAAAMPVALSDPTLAGPDAFGLGRMHPVLSLLQQWIDPADPLNFARALVREPIGAPVHVFATYGLGDSYSPPVTLATFVQAGVFTQAEPELEAIDLNVVPTPVSGTHAGGTVTLGVRQYEPADGEDGHFVVFDVAQANADMVRFFSTAVTATDGVPVIGEE
jgi:hypothetical protein